MRKLIAILCFVGLLYFLSETNPNRTEYVEWINDKTLNESSGFLEKGVISLVGEAFFDAATSRKDYFAFSIYTTDFSDIGKGKIKSIGVFNQFIPISKK